MRRFGCPLPFLFNLLQAEEKNLREHLAERMLHLQTQRQGTTIQRIMLFSVFFLLFLVPVLSLQDTVSEKKNSTLKIVAHVSYNAPKPITTATPKTKNQTLAVSSKPTRLKQRLLHSPKPSVDRSVKQLNPETSIQNAAKKNSTVKSTAHAGRNFPKSITKSFNDTAKNITQNTFLKINNLNQTLTNSRKSAVDIDQKLFGNTTGNEKKHSNEKLKSHTSNTNPPKILTTTVHPPTPKPSVNGQKPTVSSHSKQLKKLTHGLKNKNITPNVLKAVVDRKHNPVSTKNKTRTSSIKPSVNSTLTSAPKPKLENTELNVTSKEGGKKKTNTTVKSHPTLSPITTLNQLFTSSPKTSVKGENKVLNADNQTRSLPEKTIADDPTKPYKDNSSIKIVITEGCIVKKSSKDAGNITRLRETELILNPGSPVVLTHHINLVQESCLGGCGTEMTALRDKVELLEREMSALKKTCNRYSEDRCPKNCSSQGKCEDGKCVCLQGFSGADCGTNTCPANCNKKGKCVKGKCVCHSGYTSQDCSKVDKKVTSANETVTTKLPTNGTIGKTDTTSEFTTKTETPLIEKNNTEIDRNGLRNNKTTPTAKPTPNKADANISITGKDHKKKIVEKKPSIVEKQHPKDEPAHRNGSQTQKIIKNESTSKVNKDEGAIESAGPTSSSKTNVTAINNKKGKKIDKAITIEKPEKQNVIRSIKVHNITSTSCVLSWEAPLETFKNFTVTRREIQAKKDGDDANVTEIYRSDSNRSLTKPHTNTVDPKTSKKFSQVISGTARSFYFKGLRPQTLYSVSLYGSGLEGHTKHHNLALTTGPEPPTDLLFSNITETSLSVSWTKPKSIVAVFKVTYTSTVTGESGSMSVDSSLSHVLLSKLSAGSTYEISVRSVIESLESEPVTASVTTVPDSPTELKVVNITDTKALLVWKPSQAKVDTYILSYGTTKSPNVTTTVTLSGNAVEHQIRGLHRSSLYNVKITSQINRLQSSPVSITFTTGSGVKPQIVAPTKVTFHSAEISWKSPRVAFKSYKLVYQWNEEVKEVILNPTSTHYAMTELVPSSNYTIKIEGEREGQYIGFVSAEFSTAPLPFPYPKDCSELQMNGVKHSGRAEIYPEGKQGEPVMVYCDMETEGGGWTVFQRRVDGSTDFFRTWRDYSKGFGLLSGEFWLGNDVLHSLTSHAPMSLRIDLRSGNDSAYANYANFSVSSEANYYAVELSGYSGTAGDSMKYHNRCPFSTKDKDPDLNSIHCAKAYMGGWWYKNCYKANLNGLYASYSDNKGIVWIDWKGKNVSLPFTEMKLRPLF